MVEIRNMHGEKLLKQLKVYISIIIFTTNINVIASNYQKDLSQLLIADFAAFREKPELAIPIYEHLFNTYQDPRLLEAATLTALIYQKDATRLAIKWANNKEKDYNAQLIAMTLTQISKPNESLKYMRNCLKLHPNSTAQYILLSWAELSLKTKRTIISNIRKLELKNYTNGRKAVNILKKITTKTTKSFIVSNIAELNN